MKKTKKILFLEEVAERIRPIILNEISVIRLSKLLKDASKGGMDVFYYSQKFKKPIYIKNVINRLNQIETGVKFPKMMGVGFDNPDSKDVDIYLEILKKHPGNFIFKRI